MTIPGFIRNDFWRKLVALLFAIIAYWSLKDRLLETRQVYGVPVEIKLATPELVMPGFRRFEATVLVRGEESVLSTLDPAAIAATIEVSEADRRSDGLYHVRLHPRHFRRVRGVEVLEVASGTAALSMRLQRRVTREIKVSPRFSGKLSPDFRRGEVRCLPPSVIVSGPEDEVNFIQEILTRPIPLSTSVEESFVYNTAPVPPLNVKVMPEEISVQVSVERNLDDRSFRRLPVSILSDTSRGLTAEFVDKDPRANVVLSGATPVAGALKAADLRVYIDVTKLNTPGIHQVDAECHVRNGAAVVRSIQPGSFKVKIGESEKK